MEFMETDDNVWEKHVVGKLPLKEPEEPEIVFHDDKLWQDEEWDYGVNVIAEWQRMKFHDDQSASQDADNESESSGGDDEGISEVNMDGKVIFEVERVECTSNGVCSECELSRKAEKASGPEQDDTATQQAAHKAPATGGEGQKGHCDLL